MTQKITETAEAKFAREMWDLFQKLDVGSSFSPADAKQLSWAEMGKILTEDQSKLLIDTFEQLFHMRLENHGDLKAPITRADIEAVSKHVMADYTYFADNAKLICSVCDMPDIAEEEIQKAFEKIDSDANKIITFGEMMKNNGGSLDPKLDTTPRKVS